MKRRLHTVPGLILPLALTKVLAAAPLYWNPGGSGGDGTWSTSPADLNWNTTSGAPNGNTSWPDPSEDTAVFPSAAGGSVTVTGAVQVHGIVQTAADYSVTAGTITLVEDAALNQPAIDVQAGTLTIHSTLAGAAGMAKTGPGGLLLAGSATFTGTTRVLGGTLTLAGSLASADLEISGGARLVNLTGGFNPLTAIHNSGILEVNTDDAVLSYVQHAGGELSGGADLAASAGAVLYGGTINGSLKGNLIIDGDVAIHGKVSQGSLTILSGALTLSGISDHVVVAVSSGASMTDIHGGLHKQTSLNNNGTVAFDTDEQVRLFISNGGTLAAGDGILSAGNVLLNDQTVIEGKLVAGGLTSSGRVSNQGSLVAQSLTVSSGTLTNTGWLGDASSRIYLGAGTTLVADGRERFSSLTTQGADEATWRGDLTNRSAVSPGDNGGIGRLTVDGNYSQSRLGILQLDVGESGEDHLEITGRARFGGTLSLNRVGTEALPPIGELQLIDAGSYSGNIRTLEENLDGAVWFNPAGGSISWLPSQGTSAELFPGAGANQRASWISLYDDAVDPGTENVTELAGGALLEIQSGIADEHLRDLAWALEASRSSNGLDLDLLNHLSPEVYAGFNDHAVQAMRSQLGTALSAPTFSQGDLECFAAVDYFDAATSNSPNDADYSLAGSGFLIGTKTRPSKYTLLGGYAAISTGNMDGRLIEADESGWSLGVFGRITLHEESGTALTLAVSHGHCEFDGARRSAIADADGWRPGDAEFSDVESSVSGFFFGVESQLTPRERLRLIPSAGFRAEFATMDGFTEDSAPGGPIALSVKEDHQEYLSAECGLTLEGDLSDKLTAWAHLGYSADLGGDPHVLEAAYALGSRPMRIEAEGLTDDLLELGLGAEYRLDERTSLHFGYQAGLHPGESTIQGLRVSAGFRF